MCKRGSEKVSRCVDLAMCKKTCGNCEYFLKWKNDPFGGGLCEFTDARTDADAKVDCRHWKGIRYKRERNYDLVMWEMRQL